MAGGGPEGHGVGLWSLFSVSEEGLGMLLVSMLALGRGAGHILVESEHEPEPTSISGPASTLSNPVTFHTGRPLLPFYLEDLGQVSPLANSLLDPETWSQLSQVDSVSEPPSETGSWICRNNTCPSVIKLLP